MSAGSRLLLFLLLTCLASGAAGEPSLYSVASLVNEKEPSPGMIEEALISPVSLVRTTAARVIAVRGLTALLPAVREALDHESDATAARELIRTLALLGADEDLATATKAARQWPAGVDDALAVAIARRGGREALERYPLLRGTRMTNAAEFFRIALWGHRELIPFAGARVVGSGDERAWRGMLATLRDSKVAMHGPVMAASLGADSEEIRTASVWYLVRGYAMEPEAIAEIVKGRLAEPQEELSSDREDFGRELLRRMLGGEKRDDPRWQRFLESDEADRLLQGEGDVLQYLTDAEYAVRHARCEVQTRECAMPAKRSRTRTIPSQPVAPPAFELPSTLPAGLAEAVLKGSSCPEGWLGLATATVDQAGRVKAIDLDQLRLRSSCRRAIETLAKLSFATNTSIRSAFTSPVLLVHPARASLCLDEDAPADTMSSTYRAGGAVQPPKVRSRVEPRFPASARQAMGDASNVMVIVEAVISKAGCVRSLRVIAQSPYPELNGAALIALAQWTFQPGFLDGKPVDVIFNLTVNFRVP